MGRWNDVPEDSPDDWRGWKSGKYDNRYDGNSNKNYRYQNKTKSVSVGIIFVLLIGVFGFILWDQGILNEIIQNAPETIQDASKTAKDITDKTVSKVKETIDEQLTPVELEPIVDTNENTDNAPVKVIEKNPLDQPIIDKDELEKQIHSLTNQYRTQNGLKALSWDDGLSNIARSHSKDMAIRGYFSHDTPEGKDPTDRGISQGYRCQKTIGNLIYSGIAENIFQNNLYDSVTIIGVVPIHDWNSQDELAKSTVDGWMESSGHRDNILTKTYDLEGIGVEISSDSKVYITQNFC